MLSLKRGFSNSKFPVLFLSPVENPGLDPKEQIENVCSGLVNPFISFLFSNVQTNMHEIQRRYTNERKPGLISMYKFCDVC